MNIVLDIDGVILDMDKALWIYVKEQLKSQSDSYKDIDISNNDWEVLWNRFLDSNMPGNLELLINKKSYNEIQDNNCIVLMTNFPILYAKKRIDNLKNLGIGYQSIYFCDDKNGPRKIDILKTLYSYRSDLIYVDDNLEQCNEVTSNFKNSIVLLANNDNSVGSSCIEIFERIIPSILTKL